ncbi:hypothetical protein E4U43_003892 [Claviceps pusilla]|uniref:Uncharacterized protein n=1 Tax=Claviceps pusilla TaxID=123648 RepID=A0A9P7SXD9_9HYPO|nr:hypothetical protein E4U43_003892 [Claviceps pusilla]
MVADWNRQEGAAGAWPFSWLGSFRALPRRKGLDGRIWMADELSFSFLNETAWESGTACSSAAGDVRRNPATRLNGKVSGSLVYCASRGNGERTESERRANGKPLETKKKNKELQQQKLPANTRHGKNGTCMGTDKEKRRGRTKTTNLRLQRSCATPSAVEELAFGDLKAEWLSRDNNITIAWWVPAGGLPRK